METKKKINCTNCNVELSQEVSFCSTCGQTTKSKKIGLRNLIFDFFTNFLIFDFKIFRTIKAMFVPGKLVEEYFNGKNQTYTNPWRLFLIATLIGMILVGFEYDKGEIEILKIEKKINGETGFIFNFNNEDNITKLDSLSNQSDSINIENLSELLTNNEDSVKVIEKIKNRLSNNEYIYLKEMFKNYESLKIIIKDPLKETINKNIKTLKEDLSNIYVDSVSISGKKISNYDIKNLSLVEIEKKYNIQKGEKSKQIQKQFAIDFLRGELSVKKASDFAIKNTNWFLIALLPFTALIFKLLYIRRKKLFVEHLVFNLYNHSFVLMIFSFLISLHLTKWFTFISTLTPFVVFGTILYYLFAMKNYYKQTWQKTILKLSIFMIIYFILLFLFVVLFVGFAFLKTNTTFI